MIAEATPGRTGGPLDLSVVAPLYNESQNVDPLVEWILEALAAYPGSFEVILVDDGSRDDTWDRVAAAAALDPRVRGIALGRNVGQTAAMMAGTRSLRFSTCVISRASARRSPASMRATRLAGSGLGMVANGRILSETRVGLPRHGAVPGAGGPGGAARAPGRRTLAATS